MSRLHRRILPVAVLSVTALIASCGQNKSAGEASEAFVQWARNNAIPINTIHPGQAFADLQPMKKLIGDARVVGFGESLHRVHEFFVARHRLFEFLVTEMDFTAFAMETGFAEAVNINDYVLGRVDEPEQWVHNWFTWGFGEEPELLALVRWMREYNQAPAHPRKLHFYGIDVPVRYSSPRAAIDGALAYLEKVDPEYTASSREMLLPLVSQFLGSGGSDEVRGVSLDKHAALPIDVRNAYTAAIADLIAHFQRKRVDYLGRSSEESYEWGYRHAVVARQLDNAFRATASDITREGSVYLSAETWTARDRGMADNLLWALEREEPDGRIFIWAHNAHVQKFPVQWGPFQIDEVQLGVVRFNTLGLFLHSLLGHDYLSVGFVYNSGVATGWASYQTDASRPAKAGSLDAEFARVGLPMFILDLRSVPKDGPVHEWLNQSWEQRESVPEYFLLNPLQAWDALFYIDQISPATAEVYDNYRVN